MPVKIRLMRIGATKRPFYRVVAIDERKRRSGAYLELLGTYNPLTNPKEILLKQDRIDAWIKMGAQPSYGFLRIIGKAPQKQPRKPRKGEKKPDEAQPAQVATPAPEATEEATKAPAEVTPEAETPTEQTETVETSATPEPEAAETETPTTETQVEQPAEKAPAEEAEEKKE